MTAMRSITTSRPTFARLRRTSQAALSMVVVGLAFGLTFAASALALRIEDLRSIVGLMVDAVRRPRAPRARAS
jgi:hypothetical protein